MENSLKHMVDVILKYTTTIEDDIAASQQNLNKIVENHDQLIIDKTKDYFYREILEHLKDICDNINKIVDLNQQIQNLNENRVKIDKNYIKKQIRHFDQKHIDKIPRRYNQNKERLDHTSSLKYLEFWENYLEQNNNNNSDSNCNDLIKKRTNDNSLRKQKKCISSTMNGFLDSAALTNAGGDNANQLLKQIDAKDNGIGRNNRESDSITIKNELGREPTRPRIVGVIYKSEIS